MMNREQTALIEKHLPLVTHIVVQQCLEYPSHVDRDELIRAGTLGLVEAAGRFEEGRGMPFGRFAAFRIRGAVIDALRTHDWAPRSVRRSARALEASRTKLTATLNRPPTHEELAADLDTTVVDIRDREASVRRGAVMSLDKPVADESDVMFSETLADGDWVDPSELLEDRELRSYLRDAVRLLPERHRLVIIGYFFESKTSDELATLLGVSESRISQLRSEAFVMLRDAIDAQYGNRAPELDDPRCRSARRKAELASAVASGRSWQKRLDTDDRVLATAS
jgi:RNA polymerase sigma factor for flagellar operon FliA